MVASVYTVWCKDCKTLNKVLAESMPATCLACSSSNVRNKVVFDLIFPSSEGGAIGYSKNQTGYMCYHAFLATETGANVLLPKGTVTKISIRVSTNTIGEPVVVTLRKNAASTPIVISIPANTTGLFTATGSVDYDGVDDEACLMIAIPNSGTAIYFKSGTIEMEV